MNNSEIIKNWRYLSVRSLLLVLSVTVLSACQSFPLAKAHQKITAPPIPVNDARGALALKQGTELSESIAEVSPQEGQDAPPPMQDWQITGTGRFINIKPQGTGNAGLPKFSNNRDITLNFENTDIREVVKIILGDTLKLSYIIDPGVRGGVSMQTGAPVSRNDLLPLLETLLRMNNATLVQKGKTFHVVPVAKANKGLLTPQLADAQTPLPSGHSLLIRPLKNIGAEEMNEILKPLARENSIVRVDAKRNLLILSGTAQDLRQMIDVIDTFDVNWLKGLSVGFFGLENGSVEQVQKDLDAVLGGDAGKALGGLVRITPIESANGFLVVSAQREYLKEVGKWIKRFDSMAQAGDEQRLFVYRVRNGKAEDLAGLLNELFTGKSSKPKTKPGSVAPGLKGTTVVSKPKNSKSAAEKAKKPKVAKTKKPTSARSGQSGALEGEVRVVADEDHNTLLILASPRDYKRILDTLEQLDIVPLQVHIEATIVEVLLKDKLKYGISWFFEGGAGGGGKQSIGGLGGTTSGNDFTGGLSSLLNGFNWSLIDSTGAVKAVLNAFANDSLVNVLSAPSVMVLDNHEAKIRVGDEVPTLTQSQTNDAGNIIQTVQYRETGIILTVKPRVNPGGLVTMEVTQEVSAVADTEIQTNQPTIQTREINSTVAVQSGQTVVLGGLIRDKRTNAEGGAPFLYKIPVLGALFGETENSNERVELVIVLTPRVITSAEDALKITRDFRTRMQGLKEEFLEEAGVIRAKGGARVYGTSVERDGEK